jgi:hypothetical protein
MEVKLQNHLASLIEIAKNGPEEVGLAAAATDKGDPTYALVVPDIPAKYGDKLIADAKRDNAPVVTADLNPRLFDVPTVANVAQYISSGPECPLKEEKAKILWVAAQIHCLTNQGYGYYEDSKANIVPVSSLEAKTHVTNAAKAELAGKVTPAQMSKVATLAVASKVCWWIANHHVGQGGILKYMEKAIMLVFELKTAQEVTADHKTFAHAIGHWYSTGGILRALGIEGIHVAHSMHDGFKLKATRDMQLRLSSGPAGTGATTSYSAIVKRAARSAYSALMPASVGYVRAALFTENGNHNQVKFHVGRGFLECSNNACDTSHEIEEDAQLALSAYIHAIMPNSTLAGSKTIMKANDITSEDIFLQMTHAKLAMSVATDDEEAAGLIRSLSSTARGGDPMGDVRHSLNLNARAVDDVLADVRDKLETKAKTKAAKKSKTGKTETN